MSNIDAVIADIDEALENNEDVDVYDWVLEADRLAKTLTREEISARCGSFSGVRLVIPTVFGVLCECHPKNLMAFAKKIDEAHGWCIFVKCVNCEQESINDIPFELLGRDRVVTSLAVCMREAVDGY